MFFSTNFYYSPLHPSSILCFILIMFGFCLNFDLIIRQPEVPSYKSSNSWWPTTTTKQACNTKWQGPTAYQWSATKTLSKGFRKQVFLLFSTLKTERNHTNSHTSDIILVYFACFYFSSFPILSPYFSLCLKIQVILKHCGFSYIKAKKQTFINILWISSLLFEVLARTRPRRLGYGWPRFRTRLGNKAFNIC